MSSLHLKGYLLRLLAEPEAQQTGRWDDELCDAACAEYGLAGDYWRGTVRLNLTDLYSGGLLDEVETALSDGAAPERVLFRFRLNDFGRERMRQSGLLEVATS